ASAGVVLARTTFAPRGPTTPPPPLLYNKARVVLKPAGKNRNGTSGAALPRRAGAIGTLDVSGCTVGRMLQSAFEQRSAAAGIPMSEPALARAVPRRVPAGASRASTDRATLADASG